jgi:U1 small nuclear ribonucleoprotein C
MPKYYCDYCDVFLAHDSRSVRKLHNSGWKHKMNVKAYYGQFISDPTQILMDQKSQPFNPNALQPKMNDIVSQPPMLIPPMAHHHHHQGMVPPPGIIPPPHGFVPPTSGSGVHPPLPIPPHALQHGKFPIPPGMQLPHGFQPPPFMPPPPGMQLPHGFQPPPFIGPPGTMPPQNSARK